jgi:hypothetical protein
MVVKVLGREHPEYGPRIAPYCAVGETVGTLQRRWASGHQRVRPGDHTTQVIVVTTTE